MTLDDIAGRLEDLAVEHDLDELQSLATALSTVESKSCSDECRDNSLKANMLDRFLNELVMRDVIDPNVLLSRQMSRQGMYQTYANMVANPSLTHGTGGFLVNTGVV